MKRPGSAVSPADLRTVRVARQAIHHASGGVAAYELLFRQLSPDTLIDEAAHEAATAQVLLSVFGDFGVDDLAGELPLFVNTTRGFLVGDLPLPGGPDRLVVEVLEHVVLDAQVLDGLSALIGAGYRVAADDWDGCSSRDPLIRVCDVVKIDMAAVGRVALPRLVARAHALRPGITICVERVEDAEDVALAVAAGADLLQGYALHRPQTRTTRT
ncbi:EAL domain-containing protein [Jannaschia sp. R86511]|uniref:EAL domain-containing protein n=1 Tax=Jannaschia sp. R86511 TaxID=3093853 RepID=UPI0036D238CB